MEPHIFAKFKKVDFDVEIGTPRYCRPCFCFNDNLRLLHIGGEAEYVSYLQKLKAMENIFNVISMAPYIDHLRIRLTLFFGTALRSEPRHEWPECHTIYERCNQAAALRAVEMVVESGVLLPLRNLFNVKSLQFEFQEGERRSSMDPILHTAIWGGLSQVVRSNWLARQIAGESTDGM